MTVTTLELSLIDWQSVFGGYTCYVANEEDEEVSVITVYGVTVDVCVIFLSFLTVLVLSHDSF